MAPSDELLSYYLRLLKPRGGEEELSWKDKPLHSMYHPQMDVADIRKSYQWLAKDGLKDSRETLIMEAEEQALSNRGWGLPHRTGPQVQAVRRRQVRHTWNIITKWRE